MCFLASKIVLLYPLSCSFYPCVCLYKNTFPTMLVRFGMGAESEYTSLLSHLSWEALSLVCTPPSAYFHGYNKPLLKSCNFFLPCVVVLKEKVENFYTRLPFQKLTGISIRSKMPMSDKSISSG